MSGDSRSGPRLSGGQLSHWLARRAAGQLAVLLRVVRGPLTATRSWRRRASYRGDFNRKVCCIEAKSDPFLVCAAGDEAAVACVAREPFPWWGFPEPHSYTEEEAKAILEAMERAAERARALVPPFVILGNEYRTLSLRHVANFWERNVIS
jgi:nucleotide-binding universal stress UspA family protein